MSKKTEPVQENWRVTAAKIKSWFSKSGMSVQDRLESEGFVETFVSNAVTALENAIRSQIVDPSKSGFSSGSTGSSAPAASTSTSSTASRPPVSPPPAGSANAAPVTENFESLSTYQKLNVLFEAIIREAEGQSIADYLQDWFKIYTRGFATFSPSQEDRIRELILAAEQAYQKNKRAEEPLSVLGSLTYAIRRTSPAQNTPKRGQRASATVSAASTGAPTAATAAPPATSSPARNIPPPPPATSTVAPGGAPGAKPRVTPQGSKAYSDIRDTLKQFRTSYPELYQMLKTEIQRDLIK